MPSPCRAVPWPVLRHCTLSQIHTAEAADWSEAAQRPTTDVLHNARLWSSYGSGWKNKICTLLAALFGMQCLQGLSEAGVWILWSLPSHWGVAAACREHCCVGSWDRREENKLSLYLSPAEPGDTLLPAKYSVCVCVYLAFLSGSLLSILVPTASTFCVLPESLLVLLENIVVDIWSISQRYDKQSSNHRSANPNCCRHSRPVMFAFLHMLKCCAWGSRTRGILYLKSFFFLS